MLNFDVSCIVNQNKLLRNSRVAGDMRRCEGGGGGGGGITWYYTKNTHC